MFSTATVGYSSRNSRDQRPASAEDSRPLRHRSGCKCESLTAQPFTRKVIREYTEEYRNAWDEYVHRHTSGTPFHLTSWKRVIEKVFHFEARYLLVEEAGHIRAVLPLFLVPNLLFGRSLMSTPFAVYGGICGDDEDSATQLRQSACEMA